jgi:3',5'-cyclic AMP phosphodiesterase CpdA
MSRNRYRLVTACLLAAALGAGCLPAATAGPASVQTTPQSAAPLALTLPVAQGSLKFAVLGDFGNGSQRQYDLAAQMTRVHDAFPYELVVTVGDNIYGSETPRDLARKFELPYKALLDAGVKFYASLGNHDAREQRYYKPFNMDGRLYYTFKAPAEDVRFFALESSYLDREQLAWIEKELQGSTEAWKILYFHHPPYSSGGRHGSDEDIREALEPMFLKYNVSVVLTGHDHFYERVKPQNGIVYFVAGSGGQLRRGDLRPGSALTARGFDTDLCFLAVEITGDEMHFNAISRTGQVIDSGVITRRR